MFSILFSKIKSISLFISIIIIIFTSSLMIYYKIKATNIQISKDNLQDEFVVKTTQLSRYKNKLGQEVTKTIEYSKSIDEIRNSKDSIEQLFIKTLDASNIRIKELKSLLYVNTEIHTKIVRDTTHKIKTIIIKDSVKFPLYFKNNYSEVIVYPDTAEIKVNTDIIVLAADRRVLRDWWLWRKLKWKKTIDRGMVEVVSTNKMVVIKTRKTKIIK